MSEQEALDLPELDKIIWGARYAEEFSGLIETKKAIEALIQQAVRAERERCIAIMVKAFGIPKEIIAEHLAAKELPA